MTFTGKVLLTMRLTALILLCACLQVCAKGYSQISLSETNVPLQKVFKEIQKQTGYDFLFSSELLKQAGNVTVNLKNVSLQQAVEECLKGKELSYEIQEKTVIIKKKIIQPLPSVDSAIVESIAPPTDIHGRVTDSSGSPLVGASITVKGKRRGTTTDTNGEFDLTGIDNNATIIVSYTGFVSQQIKLKGQSAISINLVHSTSQLDQVQVIAYGTTTQRFSTGDVSTITSKEIEQQPVNNPLLALEGQVPGLLITQSTGLSGTGVTVQIQGQNSIQYGNDPFYVVDGVPYTSQLLPGLSSIFGSSNSGGLYNSQVGNPLNFINPSDIESISVLKDADATAIYGSRAANGAIIITTKKGKVGSTKVDFNLQQGFGGVAHKLALLNTPQYLEMRHEALNNDGIPPSLANGDYDLLLWDTTRYTDWQKTLIGGTAQYTNLNGTLSGGSSNMQYLLGVTYHRETTVFPGDFADQKGTLHFSLNNTSENQKFRIQFSANYMMDNNLLPNQDLTPAAVQIAPDAPPLYNQDGTLNWALNASGATTWPYAPNAVNPLSYLLITYNNKTNNLVTNALLSYQLLPGLNIKSSFGYTNLQTTETVVIPLTSYAPQDRPNFSNAGLYGNSDNNSWIVEPQLTYDRVIGNGKLDVLVGSTIQQSNANATQFTGTGFTSDVLIPDPSAAAHVYAGGTTIWTYKYSALFGRLGYNWGDKYLIDLNVRRDGSSRFGMQNQFHDFESAGAAWIFSNEHFIKNSLPVISFGKLRFSYGTTGNDQIGNYQYLSTYNTTYAQVPYQGLTGLQPTNLSNPSLQWEETKKLEVGMDLGFFKDRILLNTAYFQNRSSNELLAYTLPITTGFNGITQNFPATVENYGLELSLHADIIKKTDFSWSASINLTIPKNKLLSFPNLDSSSYANNLVIGQPINIVKTFHSIGVNDSTGQYEFADAKGSPTYNPSYQTDLVKLINPNPEYFGGLENTFQYKGFVLDVLFQFVKQVTPDYNYGIFPGSEGYNQPGSVLNRWQKPGDQKPIQQFNSNYSLAGGIYNLWASDAYYSDASYIRLKNLSLSWQLPAMWIKNMHLQNMRLYALGQNLLTFTHYSGLDPESRSWSTLPPLRVITFGLQIGL